VPASPQMAKEATAATARFAMPVSGSIIRGYQKGKNDGVDISAKAGTAVKAAADGTVAAITRDTDQVPILVVRHADNMLSVYANIDGIAVQKGAKVTRGQTVAQVRSGNPAFLHFELRKGFESVDPMPYLTP
ncbi:M23 family metallopeptidase, partial [Rhodovulum sulfidophilum]